MCTPGATEQNKQKANNTLIYEVGSIKACVA